MIAYEWEHRAKRLGQALALESAARIRAEDHRERLIEALRPFTFDPDADVTQYPSAEDIRHARVVLAAVTDDSPQESSPKSASRGAPLSAQTEGARE